MRNNHQLTINNFKSGITNYKALFLSTLLLGIVTNAAIAQPGPRTITVNSNADRVAPDGELTLREAIAIANEALPLEALSAGERELVGGGGPGSSIVFNLPPGATTIALEEELPAIAAAGITIDGSPRSEGASNVTITPAPGREIARGLVIAADNTLVRGLKIYGFTNPPHPTRSWEYRDLITPGRVTAKTPPGNIFITHIEPPNIEILDDLVPEGDFPFDDDGEYDVPPRNVVIENNQIGSPQARSAFGVYVFDGIDVSIQNNTIHHNDGSGIITSVRANNLTVRDNEISNNGFAGMPDAIRLEGVIAGTAVSGNTIDNNAGSAVYTFKPQGSAEISQNAIANNGQRYERAAIFLTGSGHRVTGNKIDSQPGPGVAVAVFPDGDRIEITNNEFSNLEGLNIDLVAQQGTRVQDYQKGDGRNPLLGIERVYDNGRLIPGYTGDSFFTRERRRQVANYGVNAPQFDSREFYLTPAGNVTVMGRAEPGVEIEIYRVSETMKGGVMSVPIGKTFVDDRGEFEMVLAEMRSGDKLSATATHEEWGTSEGAIAVEILALPGTSSMGGSQ